MFFDLGGVLLQMDLKASAQAAVTPAQQQQLQGSVSAALALSHTNPAAAAGLFGHFPASQLQVGPLCDAP